MRITENTFTQNFLWNVNRSRVRMNTLQNQISSGKRVTTPSDDPEAANRILRLKKSIEQNEQYRNNISDGQSMMTATEHSLDQFADLMLEAKEILSKARSGGRTPNLETFAEQIDQLISNGVQVANSKFNGKYLFGGTQTIDPPFILAADRSAVTTNPNGITGDIQVLVNDGTLQTINIDGQRAFQGAAIFATLIQVRDAMQSGVVPTAAQFDAVNSQLDYVATQGGKAGLVLNSLQMNDEFLVTRADQLQSLLSLDQDTDYAEASLLLKKEETMLDAALSIGAQLIPKTLMDFLR
jgi:flagellar hook-associated protein 3 FlgL